MSLESVIAPPRYLEGLLAALRPGSRETPPAPPPPPAISAEPLPVCAAEDPSPEERIKRALHPLDSYPRLLECAAANLPPDADDRFRFQWFGLFYQAPARDAFTLRLRLPGGRLHPCQLAGLAGITQEHAGGEAVLDPRGGLLDLPGVPVTSAVEILHAVERFGLSARRTGGDCVRSIRGGECDGFSAGGPPPPVYPLVCALEQALSYSRAGSDLPRPCEIDFRMPGDTGAAPCLDPDAGSIVLQALRQPPAPDGGPASPPVWSFVLIVPGDPQEGFLLPRARVVTGCLALLEAWAARAGRSSRPAASLAAFVGGLGPDGTSALLGGARRVPVPRPAKFGPGSGGGQPIPGCPVSGGRLLSGQLAALARCCREEGWQEVRLLPGRRVTAGATAMGGDAHGAAAAMERALSL